MSEIAVEREIDRSHMEVSDKVAIQITHMNKWYGTFHVLRDINLSVYEGERISVDLPEPEGPAITIRSPSFTVRLMSRNT